MQSEKKRQTEVIAKLVSLTSNIVVLSNIVDFYWNLLEVVYHSGP